MICKQNMDMYKAAAKTYIFVSVQSSDLIQLIDAYEARKKPFADWGGTLPATPTATTTTGRQPVS